QALDDFNRAIGIDPDYDPAYHNRGMVYNELENYEQALADYTQALALAPDFAPTYNNRGNTYYNMEKYGRAIADYEKAIELDLNYANPYWGLGNAQYEVRRYYEAYQAYRRYLELSDPNATSSDDFIQTRVDALGPLINPLGRNPTLQYINPTGTRVNVRSGPGTNRTVLGTAKRGVDYLVTGRNRAGDWIQIIYEGREGWIYYSLTTRVENLNALPVK
ncbi:MAG: tetratricopeptide repeat protein, partial [Anaerolineae bacterium]|nr:tetratricopeptide repeat protein [Anaerolineae bacterium]